MTKSKDQATKIAVYYSNSEKALRLKKAFEELLSRGYKVNSAEKKPGAKIEGNVEINLVEENLTKFDTPLIWACRNERTDVVELILNAASKKSSGFGGLAAKLLSKEDTVIQFSEYLEALEWAINMSNTEIAKILIERIGSELEKISEQDKKAKQKETTNINFKPNRHTALTLAIETLNKKISDASRFASTAVMGRGEEGGVFVTDQQRELGLKAVKESGKDFASKSDEEKIAIIEKALAQLVKDADKRNKIARKIGVDEGFIHPKHNPVKVQPMADVPQRHMDILSDVWVRHESLTQGAKAEIVRNRVAQDVIEKSQAIILALLDAPWVKQIISETEELYGYDSLGLVIKSGENFNVGTFGYPDVEKLSRSRQTMVRLMLDSEFCNPNRVYSDNDQRLRWAFGPEVKIEGNRAGYTPLILAAESGQVEIVKILLKAGAATDITCRQAPDFETNTSLFAHIARKPGEENTEIAAMLLLSMTPEKALDELEKIGPGIPGIKTRALTLAIGAGNHEMVAALVGSLQMGGGKDIAAQTERERFSVLGDLYIAIERGLLPKAIQALDAINKASSEQAIIVASLPSNCLPSPFIYAAQLVQRFTNDPKSDIKIEGPDAKRLQDAIEIAALILSSITDDKKVGAELEEARRIGINVDPIVQRAREIREGAKVSQRDLSLVVEAADLSHFALMLGSFRTSSELGGVVEQDKVSEDLGLFIEAMTHANNDKKNVQSKRIAALILSSMEGITVMDENGDGGKALTSLAIERYKELGFPEDAMKQVEAIWLEIRESKSKLRKLDGAIEAGNLELVIAQIDDPANKAYLEKAGSYLFYRAVQAAQGLPDSHSKKSNRLEIAAIIQKSNRLEIAAIILAAVSLSQEGIRFKENDPANLKAGIAFRDVVKRAGQIVAEINGGTINFSRAVKETSLDKRGISLFCYAADLARRDAGNKDKIKAAALLLAEVSPDRVKVGMPSPEEKELESARAMGIDVGPIKKVADQIRSEVDKARRDRSSKSPSSPGGNSLRADDYLAAITNLDRPDPVASDPEAAKVGGGAKPKER